MCWDIFFSLLFILTLFMHAVTLFTFYRKQKQVDELLTFQRPFSFSFFFFLSEGLIHAIAVVSCQVSLKAWNCIGGRHNRRWATTLKKTAQEQLPTPGLETESLPKRLILHLRSVCSIETLLDSLTVPRTVIFQVYLLFYSSFFFFFAL